MIINKLRSLNCAGEHNLPPPATSPKVNLLIINMLVKRFVAGEFHEVQARQFAGKGASEGLARLQARLSRCARRRDCGSGQARHPRLRAGGAARDGAAGPCGGTSGAEGLEWQRLACILLRLNLALAVRISGPPRPVTLRSKVGKGLRGAGVWGGAPVYTSPAPDLQPEQAAPGKGVRAQEGRF